MIGRSVVFCMKHIGIVSLVIGIGLAGCIFGMSFLAHDMKARYETLLSTVIYDRNGSPITIRENQKGLYAYTLTSVPPEFKTLLLEKEDRFFYYHLGINPASIVRAFAHVAVGGRANGASTITQQLAKNILGTEGDRSLYNKLIESAYAVSLELFASKEDILTMYANTVFLGNQVQGFETGSRAYFNKPLRETNVNEQLILLATLSHPSTRNPWKNVNVAYATALHDRFHLTEPFVLPTITKSYAFQHASSFELASAKIDCVHTCTTTLDESLNDALRTMLQERIAGEYDRGARNGAIVVIDAKTEQLLAMVGTPDPSKQTDGGQINMALEPRPIGSTVKPFLYLRGFMSGLRPYSLVDDREYKYPIATGFPLYPKNFDGKYHGEVTLHEALSNSLNVPSVKVLEYIGLAPFYQFLNDDLHFTPIQPYDSYQYGIALGGLEMDLLTLTQYFTLFPRGGTLAPLQTLLQGHETSPALPPQSHINTTVTIAPAKYVELVHAIISDRLTGVGQFGLKSNLNLTVPAYAVKTGTSRDFHDSWVIGYTPDFVVGVWLGNSENSALKQVTGQSGAGTIWHDAMEYLAKTKYFTNATFPQTSVREIPIGLSEEWGLPDDVVDEHRSLLLEDRLVTSPHAHDTFELTRNTVIPLRARTPVTWKVNGNILATSAETTFSPHEVGAYEISATDAVRAKTEYIEISIVAAGTVTR